MPIHARLRRSSLIRRAWFIEKLRLDEWYHYRGPSVSLANARVSLRSILFPSASPFPSLFFLFFLPLFHSSLSCSFVFQPARWVGFSFVSFLFFLRFVSCFANAARRTLSNDMFIPWEDDSIVIENKLVTDEATKRNKREFCAPFREIYSCN